MDTRVSFREVFFMLCVIMSFSITALFIMQESYDKAMIGLIAASVSVLLEFWAIMSESSRVIDLSGTRKVSRKSGKATRYNSLNGNNSSGADDFAGLGDFAGEEFYESVGNLRVYQRGEEIKKNDMD